MTERAYKYINVKESGALSIIEFDPAVTLATTPIEDVHSEILNLVASAECQKLVIDLSAMSYLPSCLIGSMVSVSTRGVEVHLANASDDVAGVMDVMGLTKRIRVNQFELVAEPDVAVPQAVTIPVAVVEGYYVPCRACNHSQPVGKHLLGKTVQCRECDEILHINTSLISVATGVYCICPACEQELKMSPEWVDSAINCDFCDKPFRLRKVR